MPAYNFQLEFVPLIEGGYKWHTVRLKRKRPTKVGDTLYFFTGLRTKKAKSFFFVRTCVAVKPVQIYPPVNDEGGRIVLNGKELSDLEAVVFASRDGFSDIYKFYAFFEARYTAEERENKLEAICWRTDGRE